LYFKNLIVKFSRNALHYAVSMRWNGPESIAEDGEI